MSDQYILSFDGGVSSGVSLVRVPADGPATVIKGWQFSGGAWEMQDFLWNELFERYEMTVDWPRLTGEYPQSTDLHIISEKFQPINHANYALTTASVEPLRIEGVLLALGLMPDYPNERWRAPAIQYFAGGKDLADKKKRLRAFLKETGNYRLPKQLNAPDNNDFISATGHAFAYAMKTLKHKPTFELVAEWAGKMDSTNERTGQ